MAKWKLAKFWNYWHIVYFICNFLVAKGNQMSVNSMRNLKSVCHGKSVQHCHGYLIQIYPLFKLVAKLVRLNWVWNHNSFSLDTDGSLNIRTLQHNLGCTLYNWLVRNSSFTQCVITRNQTNSGSEFHWEIMIILDSSISLHLIAADKLYNGIFQKKCLLLQQLQLLLRKGKQWFIHWMVEILKNQKLKQGIFLQAPVFQSIFLKKSRNKIIFHENFKITISFWGLVLCIWF